MHPLLPYYLAAALTGLLATLLLNRMLVRWTLGKSALGDLGRCAWCGGPLPWLALLPGLDLIGLRPLPRCGHAPSLGRWLILLAVLGASLGLAWLYRAEAWFELSQSLLLVYLLVPLAVVDMAAMQVESRLVVAGLLLRFSALAIFRPELLFPMIGGMLVGAGLFTMVGFIYLALRGKEGLGAGDAGVMGLLGAFVGWQGVLPVAALGAVAGLLIGTLLLTVSRKPLTTPLPFVPFLAAAGMAVLIGQNLWPEKMWEWLFMFRFIRIV